MRPSYNRRESARRRSPRQLRLPVIKVAWLRLAAIGTALLLVLVLLAQLTAVKTITVTGVKVLSTERAQQLAKEQLSYQWFGRNILLVNTHALASGLQEADPTIQNAEVHRRLFHTLAITITERRPTLNWKSGGTTYLLDEDATVIGPTEGEYAKLPTVTDSSNLPVKEGQRLAPTAFVTFCTQIAGQLPAMGYEVGEMIVPETTSEINVKTGKGIVIKFDTTRSATEELADLKAVLSELSKAKKTPTQYIDLRIEHKAYYK